jgi:NAD(P)-dependent dehydrogenase (short-subunit alcohol dehydrogenase family)
MTSADDSQVPDYLARLRFSDKLFVVLGAGQGIGRQTAHALHQAGARLVLVDRDDTLAREVAAEVDGEAITADITRREDVERIFQETADQGAISGVIDIVGVSHFSNLVDTTDEIWEQTFDLVLKHVFFVIQIAGPVLSSIGQGVLTFVSSISGLTSSPQHGAYGAAKAGLMSLVRTAAVELGPTGVRVNAVAPGGVLTPRMLPKLGEEGKRMTESVIPLRRMAVPSDIASALLFLSSELASFISGQVLVVDGGGHVNYPYSYQERLVVEPPGQG